MTKNLIVACVVTCAVLLAGVHVRAQSGYDLFQKALSTERADGNLKEAIQLYERVVRQFASDRALVARALLRMADCYQRLGDTESRSIWQQVVREYGDQPESVATARARLGDNITSKGAGLVARQIVLPNRPGPSIEVYGLVSPDGRYLPYTDWASGGNLVLRDLVSGADRRLTNDGTSGTKESRARTVKEQFAGVSSFSKDGRLLAYTWFNGDNYELRVVSLQGSGVPQFRRLPIHADIAWLDPHDWTPDGKAILVHLSREDRTAQIGLISVADGSLHVLKSVDWRGPTRMFISPDGKDVAFDLAAEDRGERDIFVLALDGSRETPVVVNPADDVVMGWSPDGKQLLFASERNGFSTGLFAVGYSRAATTVPPPQLIKSDLGPAHSIGMTQTGALYYVVNSTLYSYIDMKISPIDLETGRELAAPVILGTDRRASNADPSWSPDGQYLAYKSTRRAVGDTQRSSLSIYSRATGETRDLHPALSQFYSPRWSPDGASLVVGGQNLRGRWGVYRIDTRSGDVSTIVNTNGYTEAACSKDGKSIYYSNRFPDSREWAFIARDIASGAERELVRRPGLADLNLSPDGMYLATTVRDVNPSTKAPSSAVLVIPVNGGDAREVLRGDTLQNPPAWLRDGTAVSMMMWAPDSQSVFAYKYAADPVPTMETWRIPLQGATSKVPWTLRQRGHPSIHPDGRQVAYMSPSIATPESALQVWVIENVLLATN